MTGPRRHHARDLRDAADSLLAAAMTSPAIIDAVSQAEIDRLVAAGELIPRERLQLGPGLELAPMGRMADLEHAIIDALEYIEANKPRKALQALWKVMPPPADEAGPGDEEPGDDAEPEATEPPPGPAAEQPQADEQPQQDQETENEPSTAALPRRAAPDPDEPQTCQTCGTDTDYDQALMSYTRFRLVLCREHFISYEKPQKQPSA